MIDGMAGRFLCLQIEWEHQQIRLYNRFSIRTFPFVQKAMKTDSSSRMNVVSYLDVSEYIIKEPSPLLKPSPPQHYHHEFLAHEESNQIEAIEANASEMVLTPITSGLIRMEVQDIMDDFMLESQDHLPSTQELERRRRKEERIRSRRSLNFELFKLQNDLDSIVEYDHEQSFPSQLNSSFQEELSRPHDQYCPINSNTFCTLWSKKTQSKDQLSKDIEIQNQTTIDTSIIDYSQTIQTFSRNPKLQILAKMKQIEEFSPESDQLQKKNLLKKYLQTYLLEYQTYCFEEAWKEFYSSNINCFTAVKEGIEETFAKKIGSLSFENRRVKLLKYLEKKKRRIWRKKVSYDCRKKVADARLRIKGKFVTREQACEQLGLESVDSYNAEELKEMLQKKIDESFQQLIC